MNVNKHLKVAYVLMAALFVVGVVSYAAFSAKPPGEPVRVMFKTVAGNVLFSHNTHADVAGYGADCFDCHHHPENDDSALRNCGDCHKPKGKAETAAETCLECHEPDEVEPGDALAADEAYHDSCIGCHQAFGSGPTQCAQCHVM